METNNLDYRIIATGSTGNAVRIRDIMIDCGIAFKKMKEDLYKVDSLFLTHSHSDHINPATLASIRKEFPRVKIYGNAHVAYQFDVDMVIGTAKVRLPRDRIVIPMEGLHDVPVSYFYIFMDGLNILYATDTHRVENPDDIPLDYVFLESNYDETKLRELSKQYRRRGYDPVKSSMRHLSTQQCKEFYYVYRRDENSPLIELHQSHRFY